VGGDTAAQVVRTIARNGRVARVGLASDRPLPLDPMDLLLLNYTVSGFLATPLDDPAAEAAVWARVLESTLHAAITRSGRRAASEPQARHPAGRPSPQAWVRGAESGHTCVTTAIELGRHPAGDINDSRH
jgi:NADPH:quinone reductase-like Zn-dependent oxidoreductase